LLPECIYKEIQNTFTINGTPIDKNKLNTPEKIAAFNDSEKYEPVVIGGDIVAAK